MQNKASAASVGRIRSIDLFRGFAVLIMAVGNFMAGISWVPAWLKHPPRNGFTIADTVAPLFLFAIGLTYTLSADKHKKEKGAASAMKGFALRYLALLGLGTILSAGYAAGFGGSAGWGMIQAIGAAGLFALPFIFLKTPARFAAGLGLMAFFQFFLDGFVTKQLLGITYCGFFGGACWGGFILLATCVSDLLISGLGRVKKLALLLIIAGAAFGSGIGLSPFVEISKNYSSASYMLAMTGICTAVFAVFHVIGDILGARGQVLAVVGRNPLVMYLFHLALLGIFTIPGAGWWHAGAPVWLACLQATFIVAALILSAKRLDRAGLVIKL